MARLAAAGFGVALLPTAILRAEFELGQAVADCADGGLARVAARPPHLGIGGHCQRRARYCRELVRTSDLVET